MFVKAFATVMSLVGLVAQLGTSKAPLRVAAAAAEPVEGGWIEALPCAPLGFAPAAGGPTMVSFTCTAGTLWDGAWTGQTHFVFRGTQDVTTGDGTGTLDETFVGVAPALHLQGSLHLLGDVVFHGASNSIRIHETIVDATGEFAGASGEVSFEGLVSGTLGHGGYHGSWTHPMGH
jgi:hypothetical protein